MTNRMLEDKLSLNDINTFISAGIHYGGRIGINRVLFKTIMLGIWHDVSVLNVNKIILSLEAALNLIYNKISKGERILFVGNGSQNSEAIGCYLASTNQYYVTRPIGGLLSN